jgi:hypothetical protein
LTDDKSLFRYNYLEEKEEDPLLLSKGKGFYQCQCMVTLALNKSSKMSQLDLGSKQFSGYKWTYCKNGGFAGGE